MDGMEGIASFMLFGVSLRGRPNKLGSERGLQLLTGLWSSNLIDVLCCPSFHSPFVF